MRSWWRYWSVMMSRMYWSVMIPWRYRSVIVPVTIRINQRNSPVIIVTVIYPTVSDVILDDTFFIHILIDRPDGNCTTHIEVIEFRIELFQTQILLISIEILFDKPVPELTSSHRGNLKDTFFIVSCQIWILVVKDFNSRKFSFLGVDTNISSC